MPPPAVVINLTGSDDDESEILSFRRNVRQPFSFPPECLHMLTDQHQSKQTRTAKPPKPPCRLFVGGTESDSAKLAPIFTSFPRQTALIRSLPSFKRSGAGSGTTASVSNTSPSLSKAFASSSNATAGPSGSNGTSASGSAIGQTTTSATSTAIPSMIASATASSGQPQGRLNLTLPVARTIIGNIKSLNLYTRNDPLFVYSWFLDLQLRYDENGWFVHFLVSGLPP